MPSRYICDVLEDMRTCNKTNNYGILPALVEEAQNLANNMETQLYEYGDIGYTLEEVQELKDKKKKLKAVALKFDILFHKNGIDIKKELNKLDKKSKE